MEECLNLKINAEFEYQGNKVPLTKANSQTADKCEQMDKNGLGVQNRCQFAYNVFDGDLRIPEVDHSFSRPWKSSGWLSLVVAEGGGGPTQQKSGRGVRSVMV